MLRVRASGMSRPKISAVIVWARDRRVPTTGHKKWAGQSITDCPALFEVLTEISVCEWFTKSFLPRQHWPLRNITKCHSTG